MPSTVIARLLALLWTFTAACMLLAATTANAQTWSSARKRPALWQIISVDATSEPDWPYDREDIAKDGEATFLTDEARTDLRTTYADADANRLWLRSYVAADEMGPDLVAFFFVDTDLKTSSGGPATSDVIWPEFATDPSPGGYEYAIGVRGDGMVLGHYLWNESKRVFEAQTVKPNTIAAEAGRDRDPLLIGRPSHGYVQLAIDHALSALDQSCRARIFVRLWNDVPSRAFGDDDVAPAACRPEQNAHGDPSVLQPDSCSSNTDCPANGRCREQVCLFAYACDDCRDGEVCEAAQCVRKVDTRCDDDADCDGLVCEAGACVSCAESGARTCESDRLCSPDGSCVAPAETTDHAGDHDSDDGGVRGGAFHCSAAAGPAMLATLPSFAWLLGLAWLPARFAARRRRRRRRDAPGTDQIGGAS
jgi:hypothetical protein